MREIMNLSEVDESGTCCRWGIEKDNEWATYVWWDSGPDGLRLGWGVLLIKHETFQSLINLFPQKIVGDRGEGE
jgi:hypothetical protein